MVEVASPSLSPIPFPGSGSGPGSRPRKERATPMLRRLSPVCYLILDASIDAALESVNGGAISNIYSPGSLLLWQFFVRLSTSIMRKKGAVCILSHLEDEFMRQMATCGKSCGDRVAACEFMFALSLIKTMVPYLTTSALIFGPFRGKGLPSVVD